VKDLEQKLINPTIKEPKGDMPSTDQSPKIEEEMVVQR